MSALEAAGRYFDAWNARDAAAILACLTADGTYSDPMTGGPLAGNALKNYVESLWSAFPDLNFKIVSASGLGDDRVAAEWMMRGTNRGPFLGLPPTGKSIETPGADFIHTADGKVRSVAGYFDSVSVPRQLGLQSVIQPLEIGPFKFGTSTSVQTGNKDAPGVFSITQLHSLDEDATASVREVSRQIMIDMMKMPGFIGSMTGRIGDRGVTISAWTDEEAAAKFARQATHATTMKPFFDGSLAKSGYTSVWSPVRINTFWVRCDSCRKMSASKEPGAICTCGAPLPDRPPYW
jgi:steroid delta-isomerase-like uncharacterized protein